MKVTIQCYDGDTTKKGIKIALDARLYVPGWEWGLRGLLRGALEGNNASVRLIVIAFADEKPVGVAVVHSGCCLWLFVRKAFRRQGIGRAMYKTAMKKDNMESHFKVEQDKRNAKFFRKLGIKADLW